MIIYVRTSLLESNAQTIVNTVNTVGVMGKGLAAALRERYPDMFKKYKSYCESGDIDIGKLWLWKAQNQWVLNFPTKKHWRNPSKLEYIEAGLEKFCAEYEKRGIYEISFPRLGCGNGGLDWDDVKPLMERYLSGLPIKVFIHDFQKEISQVEHLENFPHNLRHPNRSYKLFIDAVKAAIFIRRGLFETQFYKTAFQTSYSDDSGLRIERGKKVSYLSKDDLFDIWTLLMKGPLTHRKLMGRSGTEAYYVMALLGTLPFIRQIEINSPDSPPASAWELIEDSIPEDFDRSGVSVQGEIKWA